jgi:protein-disulfide isomerase
MKARNSLILNVLVISAVVGLSCCLWMQHRRFVRASVALHDDQTHTPAATPPSPKMAERNRVPVAGIPRGPVDAPITIVEFSEFACPFSAQAALTVKDLLKEYPGKIRLYFRHYPMPYHLDAPLAAEAALAAESQGKFWEMHDKLFANRNNLKRDDLETYAGELGLDMTKFRRALDTRQYKERVDQDLVLVEQVGAKGTPAFFINGRPLPGAAPIEAFRAMVDEELSSDPKLAAKGMPLRR